MLSPEALTTPAFFSKIVTLIPGTLAGSKAPAVIPEEEKVKQTSTKASPTDYHTCKTGTNHCNVELTDSIDWLLGKFEVCRMWIDPFAAVYCIIDSRALVRGERARTLVFLELCNRCI